MKNKIKSSIFCKGAACCALILGMLVAETASAGFLDKIVDAGTNVVTAQKNVSSDDEFAMGENLAALVLGAFPPTGSEALNQYVNKVGLTVAAVSSRPNLDYHFQVVDARDPQGAPIVNAFSVPGGFIFITRGLLSQLKSEAELAGVLSHEVAHVAGKHALKAIKQAKTTGALTKMGASVASDHAGAIGGELIKEIGPAFVNNLFEKGFSRADEYKADMAAVTMAAKAGYDPNGFVSFLQILQAKRGGRNYSTIMRTHPTPEDRLARLQKFATSQKGKQVLAVRFQASAGL